jgi:hypothetical protein
MAPKLKLGGIAAGIFILSSIAAYQYAQPAGTGWQEVAWPFPRDGWPPGRAFHCSLASCGDEIDLYVRPKLGFCNCDSGVADDDEVDRVADLDMISDRFVPREAGEVVHVAGIAGRKRQYDLRMPDGSQRLALGIAASRRCDLMVAVALGSALGKVAEFDLQKRVLEFLASNPTASWMNAALTGRKNGWSS